MNTFPICNSHELHRALFSLNKSSGLPKVFSRLSLSTGAYVFSQVIELVFLAGAVRVLRSTLGFYPVRGCRSTLTFSSGESMPMQGKKPPRGMKASRLPTSWPLRVKKMATRRPPSSLSGRFRSPRRFAGTGSPVHGEKVYSP